MGRSPCCDDSSGLKKGPWTSEEDELLTSYIQKHGYGNWRVLPKAAGLNRCDKSCRLRWTNYLRPDIKRGRFTYEEEDMIIKLHSVLGNKWSKIAAHLPGRTDNEIKNYWNIQLRKKLLRMGIDPVTHKPRTDLNILSNLSKLFTTPQNLGTLINPWDINNYSLGLQPNVAEVAKLRVIQNIINQILNPNNYNDNDIPVNNNNIGQSSMALNLGMLPNINRLGNINNNNICHVPNFVGPTRERYDSSALKLVPSYNNNNNNNNNYDNNNNNYYINNKSCNNNNNNNLSSSYETLDANKLPSPGGSTINQFEGNTNSTNATSAAATAAYSPANSGFYVGLEKLLDDGNNDLWMEFIN